MKKQNIFIIIILAFIMTVSVGYALFSETITINGTATAKGNFDVEFTSATVINEVGSTGSTALISEDKNSLDITVPKLEYPGAYTEISVVVTNKGTIPTILNSIEETNLNINKNIEVSYTGLQELKNKELLQNETQTFTIKVMWKDDSTESAKDIKFTIKLNYQQFNAI